MQLQFLHDDDNYSNDMVIKSYGRIALT